MSRKDISDKQVVIAYAEYHNGARKEWPYEILRRMTGQPFMVCYRAMERAAKRGFVESGISLRTGWLTDKGKALLQEEAR